MPPVFIYLQPEHSKWKLLPHSLGKTRGGSKRVREIQTFSSKKPFVLAKQVPQVNELAVSAAVASMAQVNKAHLNCIHDTHC